MKWPNTDLELLSQVYRRHYREYLSYGAGGPPRAAKIYVPIDIAGISKELGIDPDILFGRLYYYLEPKYGFDQADGSKVPFFSRMVGEDINVVHFPLLATVLADLREQSRRHWISTVISVLALIVAVASAVIAIGD